MTTNDDPLARRAFFLAFEEMGVFDLTGPIWTSAGVVDRSPESAEDAVKAAGQAESSDQVPAHPWLSQRRPGAREWCDSSA
jgi:hypothetical protein